MDAAPDVCEIGFWAWWGDAAHAVQRGGGAGWGVFWPQLQATLAVGRGVIWTPLSMEITAEVYAASE
jgi:hypothetical protein